jgi:isocitrate dehydrogenase (NAD+)
MEDSLEKEIENAKRHFESLLREQVERIKMMREEGDWVDFSKIRPIIIGIAGGDGIGPHITKYAEIVLRDLLKKELEDGTVIIKRIEGLTLENRIKVMKAVPDDVMEEIKKCHVLLKGPTTTPSAGDPWPNIESANVAIRRELDLFANVRPVRNPFEDIDWVFFRENTEGAYLLGSRGVDIDGFSIDFRVITDAGAERILRTAFQYAREHGYKRVTVVTKSNIIKKGDGRFYRVAERVSKDYPEISWDQWFVDIMAAKLLDPKRRKNFQVIVLPNLYGDIISDEAAQLVGGVGTIGSANIGKKYAMFEAIHGSALRMVREGRTKYADPRSILMATAMLLDHIGFKDKASMLSKALDICGIFERKVVVTGHPDGATTEEFVNYLLETLHDPSLDERWEKYMRAVKEAN